jgi:hypothetical protein
MEINKTNLLAWVAMSVGVTGVGAFVVSAMDNWTLSGAGIGAGIGFGVSVLILIMFNLDRCFCHKNHDESSSPAIVQTEIVGLKK